MLAGGKTPVNEMPGGEHTSPRFAERAVELLENGHTAAALSLCLGGTIAFPDYATGHWVLGRCYEMMGKIQEAASQYRQVDRMLPGVEGVTEALRRIGSPAASAASAPAGEGETGIEFMLRQLQSAKQKGMQRSPSTQPEETRSTNAGAAWSDDRGETDAQGEPKDAPIVTATLAEIYVHQGEYKEAAAAYRLLIEQRPDEAGRYRERLAAVERLLQGVDKPGEA
jgi:tetratricopeptide (TPR) repeat protein